MFIQKLKNNWQQLQLRRDRNQKQNKLKQTIESKAARWNANEQNKDFLLRGVALTEAEEFYIRFGDLLSFNCHKFIIESIEARDKADRLAKRHRQLFGASLTTTIVCMSILTLPKTSINTNTMGLEEASTFGNEKIIR